MSFNTYIRRHAYRWHRIISLLVALPVLLWTISGFLHPVMNGTPPGVRSQVLPAITLDTNRIKMPLAEVLHRNGLQRISTFRIVKLYEVFYYQVTQPGSDSVHYINCTSGTVLQHGDRHYAAFIAQQFMSQRGEGGHQHGGGFSFASATGLPKARVRSVQAINKFEKEYRQSNKLLPVYRVNLERGDSLRLYVSTTEDRLALALNERKAWFSSFFATTHTWSFLDGLGKGKTLLLGSFSLLCFCSGVLGFYVYRITGQRRSGKPKRVSAVRRWHRIPGYLFAATTLLYAFSGAWHSFQKLVPAAKPVVTKTTTVFTPEEIAFDLQQLLAKLPRGTKVNAVSVVRMNKDVYLRVTTATHNKKQVEYLHSGTLQRLPNGDAQYARYLAGSFAQRGSNSVTATTPVYQFGNAYSMMNKRLPVVSVSFNDGSNYFIETGSGVLAASSNKAASAERFSFSNLHMHHYWEKLAGRNVGAVARSWMLALSTAGLLLVALSGLVLYAAKQWR